MWAQFGAIILSEPVIGEAETPPGGGWSFLRVHFKIWPGQGSLIETTFRQQVVTAMKVFDPGYADWQVPVTYRGPRDFPSGLSARRIEFVWTATRIGVVLAKRWGHEVLQLAIELHGDRRDAAGAETVAAEFLGHGATLPVSRLAPVLVTIGIRLPW